LSMLSYAHLSMFPATATGDINDIVHMPRGEMPYAYALALLFYWIFLYLIVTLVQIVFGLFRFRRFPRARMNLQREGKDSAYEKHGHVGAERIFAPKLFRLAVSYVLRVGNKYRYRGYVLPLCSLCLQIMTLGIMDSIVDAAHLPVGDLLDAMLEISIIVNATWIIVSLSVAIWIFSARVLKRMFGRGTEAAATVVTTRTG
jgi:hypothetical protein